MRASNRWAPIISGGWWITSPIWRWRVRSRRRVLRSCDGTRSFAEKAKAEIRSIRQQIIGLARENGLRIAGGGTHPFAHWVQQEIYPDPRYHTIVEDLKMVARANLIFGLHVHIGIEDRDTAIHIMNG